MQSKGALIAGIFAGIASPGSIGAHVKFEPLQGSDLARLRGDVIRIGLDFSNVIDKERGDKKSKSQGTTRQSK